ncbi:hypothetical protein J2Y41_003836 [Arthrobacter sp. 1088]|uniref:hypothetical protein n=1 Tax=Arthrobacter sp. 1088 TaxID=2817768 RepID=UPI002859B77E|nr:hypothetical protein [Arthrobacter sp. 1088]MDR6688250.1 hypothetical protein [Arthrobacter sp. 1088]
MAGFKGPNLGAWRAGGFRSGGSSAADVCRTALLATPYLFARARIDMPATLASRRILANSSTLNFITAFHPLR